jgi:hypothetical protein
MTPGEGLDDAAWALLSEAMHVYRDSRRSTVWLRHHLNRLTEPLRLAVTGSPRAGKSTLVNALIGEELAPVDVDGERHLFTWYQDGPEARATVCPAEGPAYEVPVSRAGRGLCVASAMRVGAARGGIDEVVVEWPARSLRRAHLIDTPATTPGAGIGDDSCRVAERVLREADAVLYLTRHIGQADLRFLQLGRDSPVAAAAPVHVLAVLSRSDESAGGRIDALVEAKQAARRRRREPRIASLCQDVLAVTPIIASAARTLRAEEHAAFGTLAALPRAELEGYLLSTDRFTAADFPAAVGAEVRVGLLERFGLFGVRLATTLVRTGCRTRTELADRLLRHSGLTELQESIAELFTGRRAALKARSALLALEWVLREEPMPHSDYLVAELERLVAGAHEFRELRLLAALRARRVNLPGELAAEARRLVGGDGTEASERLGLPPEAPTADLWTHAHAAVARWRQELHAPSPNAAQRRAAEVVVRSCEGVLARLG